MYYLESSIGSREGANIEEKVVKIIDSKFFQSDPLQSTDSFRRSEESGKKKVRVAVIVGEYQDSPIVEV